MKYWFFSILSVTSLSTLLIINEVPFNVINVALYAGTFFFGVASGVFFND